MKTYARIDEGLVVEIILPWADDENGKEWPVERRFTPEFVSTLVDITGINPAPQERWTYDGQEFSPELIREQTPEDILAVNQSSLNYYADLAQKAMTPLLVSLQLGDATEEETSLARSWQAYYRDLKSVDISLVDPEWPTPPVNAAADGGANV